MPRPILVVDDDPDIRRVVQLVLEGEGFAVVQAGTGREAVAWLEEQLPAVMLLDLNMPEMTGWEVQAWLREQQLAIPVVIMTAGQEAWRQAQCLGAAGYLAKPFDLDDILRVVRQVAA